MRRLLLSFIVSALLITPTISAKETAPKTHYKVQIIKSNKKGILEKTVYKIGDFCFSVIVGVASNSKYTKKIITDIEIFVNDKTRTHIEILEEFKGKVHTEIIDEVKTDKETYAPREAIVFEVTLQEDAYVYVLNLSGSESCVVYPNDEDMYEYKHTQGKLTIPSNNGYTISADGKLEKESFYIFTSERPLYFDKFKKMGLVKCTSGGIGSQTIAEYQQNPFGDYRKLSLTIK